MIKYCEKKEGLCLLGGVFLPGAGQSVDFSLPGRALQVLSLSTPSTLRHELEEAWSLAHGMVGMLPISLRCPQMKHCLYWQCGKEASGQGQRMEKQTQSRKCQ